MSNNSYIVVPTAIVKGVMCAAAASKNSPLLQSFNVRGYSTDATGGGKAVHVRLVATDSTVLVDFEHDYEVDAYSAGGVPDAFDWVILPGDKIVGASEFTRIEVDGDGATATLKTYKSRNYGMAFNMAVADVEPTSHHVWKMPEGTYPKVDQLYSDSLTTCANVPVGINTWSKVEKAFTTAYGNDVAVTFRGISTKGVALEFAVYGNGGERRARAIVMPLHGEIDKGQISGADPAEVESLRAAYDSQAEISARLRDRVEELERLMEQAEAAHVEERERLREKYDALEMQYVTRVGVGSPDEGEGPQPNTVIEPNDECMAIVPASLAPTHCVAYWVPDGCTVKVTRAGNAWIVGPKDVTKANRDALKANGWRWAPQRRQWWRRVA